jgi:hypothetical protein
MKISDTIASKGEKILLINECIFFTIQKLTTITKKCVKQHAKHHQKNNNNSGKRYLMLRIVGTIAAVILLFQILPLTAITTTTASWMLVKTMTTTIITKKTHFNNILYKVKEEDERYIIALGYAMNGATDLGASGNGGRAALGTTIRTMEEAGTSPSPSKGGSSSKRLVHSSFRIEEGVIKALEKTAEKRSVSLSSLVNKTLKNYVTSEMYFEELGFILVSKNFLRKVFHGLSKKHVEELGKEYGLIIAREYMCYFYPIVNSDTLVQFLEIWFRRFQSCQHNKVDNVIVDDYDSDSKGKKNNKCSHYFTVNHDINMNFTLALQSILAGLGHNIRYIIFQ